MSARIAVTVWRYDRMRGLRALTGLALGLAASGCAAAPAPGPVFLARVAVCAVDDTALVRDVV